MPITIFRSDRSSKFLFYIKYIKNQDLQRTFPTDPEFSGNKTNIQKLRNVLTAYSRRNFTIGYCQGFNFIVGRLLKIVENEVNSNKFLQEETFWMFVQIIEDILPLNYFNDLIGVMVDCTVIENMFEKNEPKFHNHIMNIGISGNLNNIINKWLISLFITSLDENVNLKILNISYV